MDAGTLLLLAKHHAEASPLLAACAVLSLGATLDQAIRWILAYREMQWDDDPKLATTSAELQTAAANPYKEVLGLCFRLRMSRAVEVLTDNVFRLDRNSSYTIALHDLVTLRNDLAHVYDEPISLRGTDPNVTWKTETTLGDDLAHSYEERGSVCLTGPNVTWETEDFEARFPAPNIPWRNVTIERAATHREAVIAYIREVLEVKTPRQEPFKLLWRNRKSGSK
jgi:hypothetical protein